MGTDRDDKRLKHIRFTADQWERIMEQATSKGITASELLRRIVDRHLYTDANDKRVNSAIRALQKRVAVLEKAAKITPETDVEDPD